MPFTASELAQLLQGELQGDGATALTGFAPAHAAKPGDLTFAENEEFFLKAQESAASAILVDGKYASAKKTIIRVANARVAFAKVLPLFFPEPQFAPGAHPTAVVDSTAQVDPTAHIGPHCVVGQRVKIGPGVVLQGLNYVGDDSAIGESSRLFPNVTVYAGSQIGRRVRIHAGTVIGSDGFGYVFDAGIHRKIPQVGNVVIDDDVEIGANVTVDRGALGPTVIGKGTKIDNLVQVAHNVTIGRHNLVIAQVGIAGSSKLGDYVILAGQVGVAGHLKIGNQVVVGAQSGVMHDIADGSKYLGSPAVPDKQNKRQLLAIQQLPELIRRVRKLEKMVERPNGAE
jgi:UDP-3-O-[3-hydroxymyristoyl] glucosamine N-acyltransferase